MIKINILYFLFFFLISVLSQLLILSKLKKWFVDRPISRSLHKYPKPTGGGVVFVVLGSLGSLYLNFFLPLACVALSITGLIDDRLNISRKLRYFMQLITVIILINISPLIIQTNNILLNYFLYAILIIFLTAIINFINFMDGIDGLVTGSMIIYFIFFALTITPSLVPLIGCLTAFLIFNWHPSKVFMGDVGSTFLGALFAGLLIQMPTWTQSAKCLIIASPILADALICVIRRFFNKENIFNPHRKHLYQRLIGQRELTHSKVSLIYISASILFTLSIYFGGIYLVILSAFLMLILGIYLDKVVAKPF